MAKDLTFSRIKNYSTVWTILRSVKALFHQTFAAILNLICIKSEHGFTCTGFIYSIFQKIFLQALSVTPSYPVPSHNKRYISSNKDTSIVKDAWVKIQKMYHLIFNRIDIISSVTRNQKIYIFINFYRSQGGYFNWNIKDIFGQVFICIF